MSLYPEDQQDIFPQEAPKPDGQNPFAQFVAKEKEKNPFAQFVTTPGQNKGFLGEIGTGFKRGVIGDLPQMIGQSAEWATDKDGNSFSQKVNQWGKGVSGRAQERLDSPANQLHPEQHNFVTNALASGAEMLPSSIVPPAVIGGGLALLPEAAIGVPASLGIAAIGGAVPAGMSQAQGTYDKVKEAGGTEAQAKTAGWKTGAIETGGEAAGTYLGGKFLGLGGKALGRASGMNAEKTIGNVIGNATEQSIAKPFAKGLAETALGETATEMGQNYGESLVEKNAGVNVDPWQQAKEAVAPTLGMTALLAPLGLHGHFRDAKQAKSIDDVLANPESVAPEERMKVVDMLYATATEQKIPGAEAWRNGAIEDVTNGLPVRRNSQQQDVSAIPAQPTEEQQAVQNEQTGVIGKALSTVQPPPIPSSMGEDAFIDSVSPSPSPGAFDQAAAQQSGTTPEVSTVPSPTGTDTTNSGEVSSSLNENESNPGKSYTPRERKAAKDEAAANNFTASESGVLNYLRRTGTLPKYDNADLLSQAVNSLLDQGFLTQGADGILKPVKLGEKPKAAEVAPPSFDENTEKPFSVLQSASEAYNDPINAKIKDSWNSAHIMTESDGTQSRKRHDHFSEWYNGGGVTESVGSQYDAHGIAKSNPIGALLNLLQNGINRTRTFDSAPLTQKAGAGAGTGAASGAYKDGPFIILSGRGNTLMKGGIHTVLVSDAVSQVIPELQQRFPSIRFTKYSEAQSILSRDDAAQQGDSQNADAQGPVEPFGGEVRNAAVRAGNDGGIGQQKGPQDGYIGQTDSGNGQVRNKTATAADIKGESNGNTQGPVAGTGGEVRDNGSIENGTGNGVPEVTREVSQDKPSSAEKGGVSLSAQQGSDKALRQDSGKGPENGIEDGGKVDGGSNKKRTISNEIQPNGKNGAVNTDERFLPVEPAPQQSTKEQSNGTEEKGQGQREGRRLLTPQETGMADAPQADIAGLTPEQKDTMDFMSRQSSRVIPNEKNRPIYDILVKKGLVETDGNSYAAVKQGGDNATGVQPQGEGKGSPGAVAQEKGAEAGNVSDQLHVDGKTSVDERRGVANGVVEDGGPAVNGGSGSSDKSATPKKSTPRQRREERKKVEAQAANIETESPPDAGTGGLSEKTVRHSAPVNEPSGAPAGADSGNKGVNDFGEKIGGARKDMQKEVKKVYSDDEIASLPLSKIWPKDESNAIEDNFAAAVSFSARAAVPSKPKTAYKVRAWADKVRLFLGLRDSIIQNTDFRERFIAGIDKDRPSLRHFLDKVVLLENIPREQWHRIGITEVYPQAYRYEDGKSIPSPHASVVIDGRTQRFQGVTTIEEAIPAIKDHLVGEKTPVKALLHFEIRGGKGQYFINKKGDPEYRKLKEFYTVEAARDFLKSNRDDLVAKWEEVKYRDNVKKTDVRGEENRQRSGKDRRGGKDATTEMFSDTFGFKGGVFGKWVSQGKGNKDRQGMLNQAFDAFSDLADILRVSPKALSLNGTLGLSFGASGHGWASAHYSPTHIAINLTKTRGAGSLAHEFFHALDNYFSHQRGGEVPFTGDQQAYRENNYITYKPEPMMVNNKYQGSGMTRARLAEMRSANPTSGYLNNPDHWVVDPKHRDGVRPEVEKALAELVEALNNSPMSKRARKIDKSGDGYWSRIIERAARSFENYVIEKMTKEGYHNDYLANVVDVAKFQRDKGRYPYLLPEEIKPVEEAFDNLFSTLKTKNTDKGIALYSTTTNPTGTDLSELTPGQRRVVKGLQTKGKLEVIRAGQIEQILRDAGMSAEAAKYMVAWHGSPHDHDGFKTEKIGTGEGAQAYGYGHYFASSKEVAEFYKETLAGYDYDNPLMDDFLNRQDRHKRDQYNSFKNRLPDLSNEFEKAVEKEYGGKPGKLEIVNEFENMFYAFKHGGRLIGEKSLTNKIKEEFGGKYRYFSEKPPMKGRLYQVELAPTSDEYLDWDKPLSEQSDVVKKALEKAHSASEGDFRKTLNHSWSGPDKGKELYDSISSALGKDYTHPGGWTSIIGDDKAASEYLHSLGIRGIKYLDGSSRSKGEGAYNYVIFDDSDIKITAKYSKSGKVQGFALPDGRAYIVPENIERGKVWPVIRHEVGIHLSKALQTDTRFKRLLQSIEARRDEQSATGKAIRAAEALVPKNTNPDYRTEEILAYLVRDAKEVGIVRRFIALIKNMLVKLGIDPKIFTAEDFAALADMAVRREANQSEDNLNMVGVNDAPLFSQSSPFSKVTQKIVDSPSFRKWFGKSVIKNGDQPVKLYHGTPNQQFLSDPSYDWIFDTGRPAKPDSSPFAGLGIFLGNETIATGHAGMEGTVHPFFVRIENPKVVTSDQLAKVVTDLASAKAYRKQLVELGKHDGIIIKDRGQVIAFNPNQVKSAESNTGDFSLQNNDVRYAIRQEPESTGKDIKANVNGTSFTDAYKNPDTLSKIKEGAKIELVREPGNKFDPDAIKAMLDGEHVGYISRVKSPQLSDLLDDGVKLEATIGNVQNAESGKPVFTVSIAKPEAMNDMQKRSWEAAKNIIGRHKDGRQFRRIAEKVKNLDEVESDIESAAKDVLENGPSEKNWFKRVAKFAAGLKEDKLNHLFSVLSLQQLDTIYGRDFAPVRLFRKSAKAIASTANELLQEADKLHQDWTKLKPKVAADMAHVMFKATTLQFDPDKYTQDDLKKMQEGVKDKRSALADARRSTLDPHAKAKVVNKLIRELGEAKVTLKDAGELVPAWEALPDDAKKIYREVRDMYQKRFEQLQQALIDQIEKSTTGKTRKNTIAKLKLEFDKQLSSGPYFPLSRFGDHVVIVKKIDAEGNEIDKMVRTFERFNNAEAFAKGMREKGFIVTTKKAKEFKSGDAPPHKFATDVIEIVNKSDMAPEERRRTMDEINQAFIKALPNLSHRKHFAHREGIKGYSLDAQRAFASNMQHSAKHISRIKYGGDLTDAIGQMEKGSFSHDEKSANIEGSLRNELVKRHDMIMNPNVHPAAQVLTGLGFAWNIGPSLASAMVNFTQTPLVSYPIMASKYGWGKSASALTQALRQYTKGDRSWETGISLENAKFLTENERSMFRALIKDGTIDVSQAHDLAAASSTDYLSLSEKGGKLHKYAKLMKLISAPFHYTEVANRQITALAAYRMAVEKEGHARAIDAARGIIEASHFDYGQENRPRIMQGNLARVILLFKQYSQNMTFLLGRNLVISLKKYDVTPEEKRQAKLQLAGIVGGHFLLSGALGMPLVGVLGGAMNALALAFGGGDDEPWDYQVAFRNYLADTVGKKWGEMISHGSVRGLLPTDIASRVSLSDLWWRGDDSNAQGRELFNHYLANVAGPVASNASAVFTGAATMAEGDIWKGTEMMLPKAAKDILKAIRYSREGLTNRQRDVLMQDLKGAELVGQVLGFTPARVSEMYEGKSAVKNRETELQRRRTVLKNEWIKAKEKNDAEGMQEAISDITKWNTVHGGEREQIITPENIRQAYMTRMRVRSMTKDGVYLPKTRQRLRDIGRFADIEE